MSDTKAENAPDSGQTNDHEKKKSAFNRTYKDSLFSLAFTQPKYFNELFTTLFPEQTPDADTFENIQVSNVFQYGHHNDFAFQFGQYFVCLIEAQSTWSMNIIVRLISYFGETLKRIIASHEDWDVYSSRQIPSISPKFFVVYTGTQKVKDRISFQEDFHPLTKDFDLCADVISVRSKKYSGSVLGQYIQACQIIDGALKNSSPEDRPALVLKAIDECIEKNLLKEFFLAHRMEVVDMELALWDQYDAQRKHDYTIRQEGRQKGHEEGLQEGREAGLQEGEGKKELDHVCKLYSHGMTPKQVHDLLEIPMERLMEIQADWKKNSQELPNPS